MTAFEAFVLGVVEGVTEFLPISSTAHLMFVSEFLGLSQSEFVKTFEIAIQSGAILAVVVLYWRSFLNFEILKRVAVAFLPTALVGALLYPFIKNSLIGNVPMALAALFLGGIALILFERWHPLGGRQNPRKAFPPDLKPGGGFAALPLSYPQALVVGLAQSVAVIPGVSRSAATIVGGLMLGLDRKTIVEFSFLLAAPTMAAATGLDLLRSADHFSSGDFAILGVGLVSSFVVALFSIRWLLSFIKTHDFTPFGIYRILIAALFFVLLLA